MIICICNNVSDAEVVETAKFVGAKTVEDLQACISICNDCETCRPYIEEILENVKST